MGQHHRRRQRHNKPQRMSFMDKFKKILRDPIWQSVGVLIALIALIISIAVPIVTSNKSPLYQATTEEDWAKWPLSSAQKPSQWKIGGNMLVSDGSSLCCDAPDIRIIAPSNFQTNDYAVEVHLQGLGIDHHKLISVGLHNQCCWFGIFVRGSIGNNNAYGIEVHTIDSTFSSTYAVINVISSSSFTPLGSQAIKEKLLNGLHAYRFEIKGNLINFIIDGQTILSTSDPHNDNSSGVVVGLADSGCLMQIQSFTVYQL